MYENVLVPRIKINQTMLNQMTSWCVALFAVTSEGGSQTIYHVDNGDLITVVFKGGYRDPIIHQGRVMSTITNRLFQRYKLNMKCIQKNHRDIRYPHKSMSY